MWFDVNAALKEVLEKQPKGAAYSARTAIEGPHKVDLLTGTPDTIANNILDCLRECETLAQASVVLTRYRLEIASLERTEPVRKIHIDNFVQHMWAGASNLHGNERKAGAR